MKSRGPKGLQLEVRARRAPDLLVQLYISLWRVSLYFYLFSLHKNFSAHHHNFQNLNNHIPTFDKYDWEASFTGSFLSNITSHQSESRTLKNAKDYSRKQSACCWSELPQLWFLELDLCRNFITSKCFRSAYLCTLLSVLFPSNHCITTALKNYNAMQCSLSTGSNFCTVFFSMTMLIFAFWYKLVIDCR